MIDQSYLKRNAILSYESVKGITYETGFYYLRGGGAGMRKSEGQTTWIKLNFPVWL